MSRQFAATGFGCVILFGSVLCNFIQQGQVNRLAFRDEIWQAQNRLLKDQVNDLEQQARGKRTYEEGLTDGLVRSDTVGYTTGYHSAIQQIAEQRAIADRSKVVEPTQTSLNAQ